MDDGIVLEMVPLTGAPWPTVDPFLFCVHHDDAYPAGNGTFGPDASLAGHEMGADFAGVDGWRMYHGAEVPGFPQHPHRGFETVTILRKGTIDHFDSLGATARYGAYVMSKFALIGLTQTLALELAPYRINVNTICPGLVDTERLYFMAEALKPEGMSTEDYRRRMLDERASDVPLGRAAVADDIARTAAFLASAESDYLTGLAINVTGGGLMT